MNSKKLEYLRSYSPITSQQIIDAARNGRCYIVKENRNWKFMVSRKDIPQRYDKKFISNFVAAVEAVTFGED